MTEEEIRKENLQYFGERGAKTPSGFLMTGAPIQMDDLVGAGEVKALTRPDKASHKGQNGKLLIIGGSTLFHGASLWALKTASRIVDMVFYASVPENMEILKQIKGDVLDFISIPREEIEDYIEEADCMLIGPGMVRVESSKFDEGEQTRAITEYLLKKYPEKQWVIDAGAIQVLDPLWIPEKAILTPHHKEFETLIQNSKFKMQNYNVKFKIEELVKEFAREYKCIIILKGERDIVSDGEIVKYAVGGNVGMTKGGTGDVLAGLVAAFACKNEPFLAARVGSFLNKLAGDMLYKKVNTMFNASDLCETIPEAYKMAIEF